MSSSQKNTAKKVKAVQQQQELLMERMLNETEKLEGLIYDVKRRLAAVTLLLIKKASDAAVQKSSGNQS